MSDKNMGFSLDPLKSVKDKVKKQFAQAKVEMAGKFAEGTKSIDEEYQTLLNYKKQALEQINQILAMRDEVTSQTIEETNNYVDK